MWLSTRTGHESPEFSGAEIAMVSLGGAVPTVVTSGGQIPVTLFGPGGYVWVPKRYDEVLVVKAGGVGEEDCIAGAEMDIPEGLLPGEVAISSEGASLTLKNDGRILLDGQLFINGEAV